MPHAPCPIHHNHHLKPFHQIEKLDDVADTLEELWLSYNQITSLDGLGNLRNLTTLYIANNNVRAWSELDKIVSTNVIAVVS